MKDKNIYINLNRINVADAYVWNSLRYSQIYNDSLAKNLLQEEIEEYNKAKKLVVALDNIGDIFFVACGIAWKLKIPNFTTVKMLLYFTKHSWYRYLYLYFLFVFKFKYPKFLYTFKTLCSFVKDNPYWLPLLPIILQIISKSNETKKVESALSHVKANIKKGPNYVAPTRDLRKLLHFCDK